MQSLRMPEAALWISLLLLAACREPNDNALYDQAHAVAATASATRYADERRQPATLCNLEFIDGTAFAATPVAVVAPIRVRGWLGSLDGAPAHPELVLVDGGGAVAARYPLTLDRDRPDVVRAYPGRPGLERSGFEVVVDPAVLAPQEYHLYLAYDSAGARHACDNGRRVRVSR